MCRMAYFGNYHHTDSAIISANWLFLFLLIDCPVVIHILFGVCVSWCCVKEQNRRNSYFHGIFDKYTKI